MESYEQIDQAEREVLGAVLRSESVLDEIATVLTAEDFRLDAHRKIYAAFIEMFQNGKAIDVCTVGHELNKRGQWEDIGRGIYLAQLLDSAPTSALALHHARIVRDHALLRGLAAVGAEIHHDATHPTDSAERILEAAEQKLLALGESGSEGAALPIRESAFAVAKRIDDRAKATRSVAGMPTGFDRLDVLLSGLQSSELIVLAARPGVGKSALGVALVAHVAARERVAVFVASLEMASVELVERLITARARISSFRMQHGCLSADEYDRAGTAVETVAELPVFIDDCPRQSTLRIAANARRLKRKHGIGLVVVDYLQLIEPENRREPRHEQVGGISRRLKILARDLAIPIVALAQLNRETESRANQRPRLSDLRESGSIEADADTVILLHRDAKEWGESVQTIDLIVAKQRNGPVGEVSVQFHADQLRFEEPNPFEGRS